MPPKALVTRRPRKLPRPATQILRPLPQIILTASSIWSVPPSRLLPGLFASRRRHPQTHPCPTTASQASSTLSPQPPRPLLLGAESVPKRHFRSWQGEGGHFLPAQVRLLGASFCSVRLRLLQVGVRKGGVLAGSRPKRPGGAAAAFGSSSRALQRGGISRFLLPVCGCRLPSRGTLLPQD